jgi:hypothetical protein
MKLALLAALGLVALPLAGAPAGSPRVVVAFDHPEKFTDINDSFPDGTPKGRQAILDKISAFIQDRSRKSVPDGYTLSITFTDIKLAGQFEPWRGPQFDDVRIIRDIYPPWFKFTYTVTDPAGKVVLQGTKNLTDLNFQLRLVPEVDDPLRYEKSILADWISSLKRSLRA